MKKFSVTLTLLTFVVSLGFAQVKWECPLVKENLDKYASIKAKIKLKNHQKFANALLEQFPLNDDGCVWFQYIFTCNKEINIEEVSNLLAEWYKSRMPGCNPRKEGMINRLSASAKLNNIGAAAAYMNPTFISAEEEVTIDIKEDRIRVTLSIPRYISSSALSGIKFYSPGACYPAEQKGIQKDAYALAFMICNATIIDNAKDILDYINKNMNKQEDVDW